MRAHFKNVLGQNCSYERANTEVKQLVIEKYKDRGQVLANKMNCAFIIYESGHAFQLSLERVWKEKKTRAPDYYFFIERIDPKKCLTSEESSVSI